MSFQDGYGIQQGDVGNGPPVSLPDLGNAPPTPRITVTPRQVKTESVRDPYAWANAWQPPDKGAQPFAWAQDWSPESRSQAGTVKRQQVGAGEAAGYGVANAASFGTYPAIAGMVAAGGEGTHPAIYDIATMLHNVLSSNPDPQVQASYERGRQAAQQNEDAAQEQHPLAYLAGQLVGGAATPGFGAMRAAGLGGRIAAGGLGGAIGGGLYGAGSELGAGGGLGDIAEEALRGGTLGAATGGVLGGAIGPRLPNLNSPAQRARQTAIDIGAPLPRGLVSDVPGVQGLTARLRSFPFSGIGERVGETAQAAGNRIEDVARGMTGGPLDRASADVVARPGLQTVIDQNKADIDTAYDAVRNQIDPNAVSTMPRTQAALDRIVSARKEAGWEKPEEGLQQFRNVAKGTTVNGALRAKSDARNAGSPLAQHPGYDAGDFRYLGKAMAADVRDMVGHAARDPQAAIGALNNAERIFAQLSERNDRLGQLLNTRGEGAISSLLGAARGKGGDVRLLSQLKGTMKPADFEQIGGVLLHELGFNAAQGGFSLQQFQREWNKVSPQAKAILFSQDHRKAIEDIAAMGKHIKGSLRESNTSHTAHALVAWDILEQIATLAVSIGAGTATIGHLGGAAGAAGTWALARWLASPAKAASMSSWARAYRAVLDNPKPGRTAAFNLATRNLANNLGIPVAQIIGTIQVTP
jgi:hypothetical protein